MAMELHLRQQISQRDTDKGACSKRQDRRKPHGREHGGYAQIKTKGGTRAQKGKTHRGPPARRGGPAPVAMTVSIDKASSGLCSKIAMNTPTPAIGSA